jgi:tRNA-dihydrouridine synthase
MTSASAVSPRARSRHRQLDYLPEERPIAMQLSGNDPAAIASSTICPKNARLLWA